MTATVTDVTACDTPSLCVLACERWDGFGGHRKKEKSPKNFIPMNLKKPVPVFPFKNKIDWKSSIILGAKIVRLKISLQSAVQVNIFLEENHENCRIKLKSVACKGRAAYLKTFLATPVTLVEELISYMWTQQVKQSSLTLPNFWKTKKFGP